MNGLDLGQNIFYVYYLRRMDKADPEDSSLSRPFYIGKGSNGRSKDHRKEAIRLLHKPGRKTHKVNIIHKLWRQGLDFTEDIIAQGLTEQEAFELEMEAITLYGRVNSDMGCLANLTNGGDGVSGLIHSDEAREIMSRKSREIWDDPEYRTRMSELLKGRPAWNKGVPSSEKTRQKLIESHKGLPNPNKGKTGIYSPETIQRMKEARSKQVSSGMKGKNHTDETKKQISESRKGKPAWNKGLKIYYEESKETRKKRSESKKGHLVSQETRDKIGKSNSGRACSKEQKEKLRRANLGKKYSLEVVNKRKESSKITWKYKRWDRAIGRLIWT